MPDSQNTRSTNHFRSDAGGFRRGRKWVSVA